MVYFRECFGGVCVCVVSDLYGGGLVGRIKVLLRLSRIRHHRLGAGLPVHRAHLAVHISVLQRLHQAQRLVNIATDRQIVDGDLAQVLLAVDDEQAAEWHARLFVEDTVVPRHLHRLVGQQRNIQMAEAALLARLIDPGQMCVVAVGGAANQLATDGAELGGAVRVGDDLSGADKGAAESEASS